MTEREQIQTRVGQAPQGGVRYLYGGFLDSNNLSRSELSTYYSFDLPLDITRSVNPSILTDLHPVQDSAEEKVSPEERLNWRLNALVSQLTAYSFSVSVDGARGVGKDTLIDNLAGNLGSRVILSKATGYVAPDEEDRYLGGLDSRLKEFFSMQLAFVRGLRQKPDDERTIQDFFKNFEESYQNATGYDGNIHRVFSFFSKHTENPGQLSWHILQNLHLIKQNLSLQDDQPRIVLSNRSIISRLYFYEKYKDPVNDPYRVWFYTLPGQVIENAFDHNQFRDGVLDIRVAKPSLILYLSAEKEELVKRIRNHHERKVDVEDRERSVEENRELGLWAEAWREAHPTNIVILDAGKSREDVTKDALSVLEERGLI